MTHGLDSHTRTSHTADGIRGSRYPAPQTLLGEQPTALVVPLRRSALRTVRDGTNRPAALGALDDHQRLRVRAVRAALGWAGLGHRHRPSSGDVGCVEIGIPAECSVCSYSRDEIP